MSHPKNKFERRKIDAKKKEEGHARRVWKKQRQAQLREQETEDELRTANSGAINLTS